MADIGVINTKAAEIAENVQVLSELGFIGESDETRDFRKAWNSLSEKDKLFYRGWIQGSISAMAQVTRRGIS